MAKERVMDKDDDDKDGGKDDFDRFLAWLNPNRDEAEKQYPEVCRRLTRRFRVWGCPEADAEDLAQVTIHRVVGKMSEIADIYVGDTGPYLRTVARYVFLEYIRPPVVFHPLDDIDETKVPRPAPDPPGEKELWDRCLYHCLNELQPDERRAALLYYADEGRAKIERRREMAEQLGMTVNALRIYLHRIRETLRLCIEDCLEQAAS